MREENIYLIDLGLKISKAQNEDELVELFERYYRVKGLSFVMGKFILFSVYERCLELGIGIKPICRKLKVDSKTMTRAYDNYYKFKDTILHTNSGAIAHIKSLRGLEKLEDNAEVPIGEFYDERLGDNLLGFVSGRVDTSMLNKARATVRVSYKKAYDSLVKIENRLLKHIPIDKDIGNHNKMLGLMKMTALENDAGYIPYDEGMKTYDRKQLKEYFTLAKGKFGLMSETFESDVARVYAKELKLIMSLGFTKEEAHIYFRLYEEYSEASTFTYVGRDIQEIYRGMDEVFGAIDVSKISAYGISFYRESLEELEKLKQFVLCSRIEDAVADAEGQV